MEEVGRLQETTAQLVALVAQSFDAMDAATTTADAHFQVNVATQLAADPVLLGENSKLAVLGMYTKVLLGVEQLPGDSGNATSGNDEATNPLAIDLESARQILRTTVQLQGSSSRVLQGQPSSSASGSSALALQAEGDLVVNILAKAVVRGMALNERSRVVVTSEAEMALGMMAPCALGITATSHEVGTIVVLPQGIISGFDATSCSNNGNGAGGVHADPGTLSKLVMGEPVGLRSISWTSDPHGLAAFITDPKPRGLRQLRLGRRRNGK